MPAREVPADFGLVLDPGVRRPRPEVLIGGAPIRVLRLTPAGGALVDAWAAGAPVGRSAAARSLATRLLDAGLAHPRPASGPAGPAPAARVVIPVLDDAQGLNVTLASLAATAPDLEVVVVDDGSSPPVQVPAGHAPVRVRLLRLPSTGGPAAARNHGWREGGGGGAPGADDADVIVFVDAGCVLSAKWLPVLLGAFADPGLAAAAPRVASRAAPTIGAGLAAYEQAHSSLDMGPVGSPVRPGAPVPYVPTAVLAVRSAALDECGGFDEELRFGEDVDLVWRLAERGWRVRYLPAAGATHPARPSLRAWLRQRFDYGRSAAPLAARHGRAAAPLTVSPWSVAVWGFVAAGRRAPAVFLAAGTAAVLARRAGSDRATAAELFRLAVTGHARAGGPIAGAVRRAWLLPTLSLFAVAWRRGDRRTRLSASLSLVGALAGDGLVDWVRLRPAVGPLRWLAWRLADDLAYQAGLWAGAWEQRSAAALLPRW